MNKKHKINPIKMNKDVSPDNYPKDSYYDAFNMRVIGDDSQTGFSFFNDKGNTLQVTLPRIINVSSANGGTFEVRNSSNALLDTITYTNSNLNSIPNLTRLRFNYAVNLRDKIIIFSSDLVEIGYCQLWLYTPDTNNLKLLYNNKLDFSINQPVKRAITRYENELVQKVYFTDNVNTLKFANIADENLINYDVNQLENAPDITYSKPKLIDIKEGGAFKAGVVQYAYTTYNKFGAETKISPFSDLITLNENKGLEDGDDVRKSYEIQIDSIPEDMTYIKVYRLFWANVTNLPEVNLIIEESITGNSYTFTDDGNLLVGSSSLDEILFLGNDPMIVKDMRTKDNVLFPINIKYKQFDFDFDARAYRFDSSGDTTLVDNTQGTISFNSSNLASQVIPETFDCINPSNKAEQSLTYLNPGETQDPNFNKYIYQADGTTLGAQGKNVKVRIRRKLFRPENNSYASKIKLRQDSSYLDPRTPKSLKRDEVYRFYIRGINKKGQRSFVKWVCDLRMPNQDTFPITRQASTFIEFSSLYVEFTVENLPDEVVAYEILRSERTENDKTIVSQGVVNPMIAAPSEGGAGSPTYAERLQPSYLTRTWHNEAGEQYYLKTITDVVDLNGEIDSDHAGHYDMNSHIVQMFSPEIIAGNYSASPADYMIMVGGIQNFWNRTYRYRNNKNDLIGPIIAGQNKGYAESFITDPGIGLWTRQGDNKSFGAYNTESVIFEDNSGDEKNYRSLIRKGGVMFSNGTVLLRNNGHLVVDENSSDSLLSYDDITNSTIEFMDGIYVQRNEGGNKHKMRANNSKNLTMQIGFYNKGLGTVLRDSGAIPLDSVGKFIIVDHKRSVANQYGGDTYEAISRGNPIVVSDHVPKSQTTVEVFNGDTFISYFNLLRTETYSPESFISNTSWRETLLIPLESSFNLDLRTDKFNNNDYPLSRIETRFSDYYAFNTVYNLKKKYGEGFAKPFNFTEIQEFDNRVLFSNTKINGELVDNWLRFSPNNYKDVNGEYGAAMSIHEFKDQLYVFQPEAVALLSINPRVYQQSSDGVSVLLGSGETLQNYHYITTTSGCINQQGVVKTPQGLFYIDVLNKNMYMITNQEIPISDVKGMHSYFANIDKDILKIDNPLIAKGIVGYYDEELKDVNFSILESNLSNTKREMISYSLLNKGFHYRSSNHFPIAINNRNNIYVTNSNLTSLYLCKTNNYGVYFDNPPEKSTVTFILNPESDYTKVFDTLLYNSKVLLNGVDQFNETLTSLSANNDYQSASVNLTVGENVKRKFREWRIHLPRQNGTRNRLRSQYLYLTLEFQNDGVRKFSLQDVVLSYNLLPASFI